MEERINSFVSGLIALQQDGPGAVSAPTNWSEQPLLYVETDLDKAVNELVEVIAAPISGTKTGRWHFFVGSPGNGKSAAVGRLAKLLSERGFQISDPDDVPLGELSADRPPYLLKVSEQGKLFARAWIAQDASVLPDPYKARPNPADELIGLMQDAEARGVSLVVCTNRGVLERAYAQTYLDTTKSSTCWFRAIQSALKLKPEVELTFSARGNGRRVYESVQVTSVTLDRRSLLLKSQTLDALINSATAADRWTVCEDCVSAPQCPYFQNRNWLADQGRRAAFVRVLKRAEVLSGHVIVFREAVALLSVVLSGCPGDIKGITPCAWVHRNRKAGAYFSLLARRIYATVFSAYSPLGLEFDRGTRATQIDSLRNLLDAAKAHTSATDKQRIALERALKDSSRLSKDLGAERLIGADGVFRELDVFGELLDDDFWETWGERSRSFADVSPLENECWEIWRALAEASDNSPNTDASTHAWLIRWMTALTGRCGALLEGRTAFATELDELIGILEGAQLRRGELIASLTAALRLSEEGAEISQFATIKGSWVTTALTPSVDTGRNGQGQPDAIALVIKFGGSEFLIPARAFAWLKRRHGWHMSLASFPTQVLQTARDTLSAAASVSNYDLEPKGIEILVKTTDGKTVSIARFDAEEVEVDGL